MSSIYLNDINFDIYDNNLFELEEIKSNDIAIIGMSGKFAGTENLKEFWKELAMGNCLINEIKTSRTSDIDEFLNNKGINKNSYQYAKAAYLSHIDYFDYEMFGLSPKEAQLTDPNQRLFLEETWKALEDAGYACESIKGSRTGVFIGYSSDFGNTYKDIICTNDPESIDMSLAGNIKSLIASRISYYLDLKGPAITIDTACSSALVAIHQAVKSLSRGECDMCISGSIKLITIPVRTKEYTGIGLQNIAGVESKDGITRPFDNTSTGTGMGEGVGVVILKPLSKAISDKDNVLAVIKGSAINQDGTSMGITAPNSIAQYNVICDAWKDASITPETVTYIETHGTGTSLGDPIEIDGIQKAFEKFTGKKQFCAIGTVKSNIGHLDHAAGIAGLLKVILSLQHRKLPPLVNFNSPNLKINFTNSPVYINDKLTEWVISNGDKRRAGISSFGLSGTNSHIILEEAPVKNVNQSNRLHHFFLPISAKTKDSLLLLVKKYKDFIEETETLDLCSLCYTASIGRFHFSHRLFIVFNNKNELENLLTRIYSDSLISDSKDYFYGNYSTYQFPGRKKQVNELTTEDVEKLTQESNKLLVYYTQNKEQSTIYKIANLYIKGANINWELFFNQYEFYKISLPTYPFKKTRCWIEPVNKHIKPHQFITKETSFSLVGSCIFNFESQLIYSIILSPKQNWELAEHKINSKYILPGTSYIEIIIHQIKNILNTDKHTFIIENLFFIQPFGLDENEFKELQTLITKTNEGYNFQFISYHSDTNESLIHAKGTIKSFTLEFPPSFNINSSLLDNSQDKQVFNYDDITKRGLSTGKRWNCNKGVFANNDKTEYIGTLELDDLFHRDFENYFFHPALMDCAINAVNFFISEDLYLPFSYKELKLYKPVKDKLYAYFKLKQSSIEIFTFDILIFNERKKVIAEITEYSIKRAKQETYKSNTIPAMSLNWVETENRLTSSSYSAFDNTILFITNNIKSKSFINKLKEHGKNFIIVYRTNRYKKYNDQEYDVDITESSYFDILNNIQCNISQIIFIAETDYSLEELADSNKRNDLLHLLCLTKVLTKNKYYLSNGLYIITQNAYRIENKQELVNPFNRALIAMANNINYEVPKLNIKLIDYGEDINTENITYLKNLNLSNIAILKGKVYRQELDRFNLVNENIVKNKLVDDNKTYVITGGTGAIGLEVASNLAELCKCNIILISRSKYPKKSEWAVLENSTNRKLSSVIDKIKIIQEKGSTVSFYACDVSSSQEMKTTFEEIYSNFGSIHGIFHCAGLPGKGLLINKDETSFIETLKPKINGSILLYECIKHSNLDFIVFFSSVNSIDCEMGQTDYSAANAFMDSYAQLLRTQGVNAISINWPAWEETGMAVEHNVDMSKSIFSPIRNEKALNAMWMILTESLNNIIPTNLNEEYINSINHNLPFIISKKLITRNHKSPKHPLAMNKKSELIVNLKGTDEVDEIMYKVGLIWSEVLGLEEIDIHESFYNLGGNSIIAMNMIKKYEDSFPGIVEIADVFTYTTIYNMHNYISSQFKNDIKSELSIEEILDKLSKGEISMQQAEQLMK